MSVPRNSLLQQRCSSYTDETSLLGNGFVQSIALDECIYFNSNDATHISVNISFIGDVVDLQNNLTCAIARHWSAVALLFLSYVRLISLLVYLTCSSLVPHLLVTCLFPRLAYCLLIPTGITHLLVTCTYLSPAGISHLYFLIILSTITIVYQVIHPFLVAGTNLSG